MKTVGIDIGTTSISAVVYDNELEKILLIESIKNDYKLKSDLFGVQIQDADKIIETSIDLLIACQNQYPDIAAIGLTGQMHGILYIDDKGDSISPLFTWQDETGSASLGTDTDKNMVDLIWKKTGLKTYTGYGLVTYLVHINNPSYKSLFPQNAYKIATIADYLAMKLTSRKMPLIHITNAASLGFYDLKNHKFYEDKLSILGGNPSILPEITDTVSQLGSWQEIPVFTALGDNQAAFYGAVGDDDKSLLINIGTGGQIARLYDEAIEIEGVETRPFNKGKYLLVGAALCSGRAYGLLEKFFGEIASYFGDSNQQYSLMETFAIREDDRRLKDDDYIGVRTTFAGTREDPSLRGLISNISENNFTAGGLVNGFLQGMVDELYGYYALMDSSAGLKLDSLIGAGNGIAKNPRLQDMIKKTFKKDLILRDNKEEAACACARLAFKNIDRR